VPQVLEHVVYVHELQPPFTIAVVEAVVVVVDVVGIIEVEMVVVLVCVVIVIGVLEVIEDDPSVLVLKHSQQCSGPVEQCPSNGSTSISIYVRSP